MITFTHPLLLLGLAGLALPLLAHLIHQKTTVRIAFPSIRFIMAARIPQQGRRLPRDLLLMLMRMLILAGIVLALAGMQWTPPSGAPAAAKPETVFVLDLSASTSGWGALDEARANIARELDALEGEAGLIAFAANVLRVFPVGTPRGELKQYVRHAQAQPVAGKPRPAIEQALKLFSDRATARQLQIHSDFQLTDWQDVAVTRLERGVRVTAHPAGAERDGNRTILAAQVSPGYQNELRVSVSVRNDASKPAAAELALLCGAVTKKQALELPAGETVQAQLSIPPQTVGARVLLTAADVYELDNTYHFWAAVPPANRVALIEPEQADAPTEEELLFIGAALSSTAANQWKTFTLERIKAAALDAAELRAYSAIVFPGATGAALERAAAPLREYVRAGGTLFCSPGEPVAAAIHTLRQQELFDLTYRGVPGRARDQLQPFRISALAPDSNLARVFEGAPLKDLLLTRVHQFVSAQVGADTRALIELEEHEPLLLEQRLGEGRVLIALIRLITAWTDLPLRSGFLPLLHEVLYRPGAEREDWPQLHVGNTLEKNGRRFAAAEAGTFEFEGQYLAVNVTREESWPAVMSRQQAEALFSQRLEAAAGAAERGRDPGRPLWPWLAAGAMLLYTLENLLSRPRAAQLEQSVTDSVHA